MKKYLLCTTLLIFISCGEDEESIEDEILPAYIGIVASGIIDFQTDAFEDDTMYTWYNVLDIEITASYDSNATDFNDIYKQVSPGKYYWSGRGVTFYADTINFQIGYDTTDVSGEFIINENDICIFTISTDDSLKIGVTESTCNDDW